jgi:YjbE family integral membrane protein
MGIDSAFTYLNLTLEVFFLDLLLSGDNAVVIALACRSLPMRQQRQAMVVGTGIAIALRVLLTLLASALLQIPVLKLLGGIALTVIAIRLILDDQGTGKRSGNGTESLSEAEAVDLWSIVGTVIIADLVMSLDNVVALAAVAKGNVAVLALGLLLSVPILMFGSWYVQSLLVRYPILTRLGGAMLGWFAGDIAVSDPLYSSWVEHQSPALMVVVPALTAAFVLLQSRIIDQSRASAAAMRPEPKVALRFAAPPRLSETGFAQGLSKTAVPELVPLETGLQAPLHDTPIQPALPDRAEVVTVNAGTADPSIDQASVQPRRGLFASKWLWLVAAGGVIVIGVVYSLATMRWMPVPVALTRYDCSSKDVSVFYKRGAQKIRLVAGASSLNGVVFYDNLIEWDNAHAVGQPMGFAPPTRILYADGKTLRIDGGMFEDVTCRVR